MINASGKSGEDLDARFVHIGAGHGRSNVGAESRAGLLEIEDVALRVAVPGVARKTTAIAAGRKAANHLAT